MKKKKNSDDMPVGKRTRLQRRLREKEYRERNKKVRLSARSKHRKVYAEKRVLDSVDDSDEDEVIVIDEAEYIRLVSVSLLQYRNCSPDVVIGFEENSKDSAPFVGDRPNSLSTGIDNDKVDEDGFKVCGGDHVEERGYQTLGMKPVSEVVGDGGQSSEMNQGFEGCGDHVVEEGCQFSGMKPGSEVVGFEGCGNHVEEEGYQISGMKPGSEAIGDGGQSSGMNQSFKGCDGDHVEEEGYKLSGMKPGSEVVGDDGQTSDMREGFKGCGDHVEEAGYKFSGMKPDSETIGGVGDGDHSSGMHQDFEGCGDVSDEGKSLPVQPSCVSEDDTDSVTSLDDDDDDDDHKSSDEDFEVDEAEICDMFSPGYSSAEDDKYRRKTRNGACYGNGVDRVIVDKHVSIYDSLEKNSDEDIQRRLDDNELGVQLLFKSGEYGSNINQGESPKNNCTGKERMGREPKPPKNNNMRKQNRVLEPEPEPHENNNMRKETVEVEPEPLENNNMGKEGMEPPKNNNMGKQKMVLEPESPENNNMGKEEMEHGPDVGRGNSKRCRLPRTSSETVKSTPPKKKRIKKLKPNEAENVMMNTILEKGNAGLMDSCISSSMTATVNEKRADLPLKFRFGVQDSAPESSKEVSDTEKLFQDLEFALRTCDIGEQTPFQDENDDGNQGKFCHEGNHYLIHDDEIGIRCKYCSYVKLEIRHVLPAFNMNPFGRGTKRNYCQISPDNNNNHNALDGTHIPNSDEDPGNNTTTNIQGTVWELIPDIFHTLYPHQQQGFEFMWRNIEGGIKLDQLNKPTKFGSGGCLICHAPGTGKTRLAITFLLSFIRKYPLSRPVIIAPKSMLLTWEEEFGRWNVDVPFINMNKTEFSGNEDFEVLQHVATDNVKSLKTIRVAKLYTWAKGKGILGISYTLFEKLAGDRKGVDKNIRRALLEQPGILVLDEGHTARNDQSNIWNVLNDVQTKRRIILSGTPFQNNFEELSNTLSLVREEFQYHLLPGNKYMKYGRKFVERRGNVVDSDRRIAQLKIRMKSFVHVHKGEILKKTLRGLFHSVVLLKPSDLQKICFQQLNGLKNGLSLDHLVSIASVHPWLLHSYEHIPESLKVLLKDHSKSLDAGVKVRFLFDLINLAQGEKILVFSQFLSPLKFIGNLLKARYKWSEEKELLYMDGKQDVKQRQAFIRHFNNPKSEARVLLASTKACCEGIHLVGASRVVLLDVVWNPSVERQAISRAYRLGQKKDVYVYHLITSGTQEEAKYGYQVTKDRVSEKIFCCEKESQQNNVGMIPPRVSEDRILEAMIQNEKSRNKFLKIIYQPKADELIESFGPVNL